MPILVEQTSNITFYKTISCDLPSESIESKKIYKKRTRYIFCFNSLLKKHLNSCLVIILNELQIYNFYTNVSSLNI
jgi:hypothetical protein